MTTAAYQHKKVPNAMGVSQLIRFTQQIKNYSNGVSQTAGYQQVKTYTWKRFF